MGLGHRFVLFELNEVPIRVVQHFADRHPRSSFARILQFGGCWDTITPDTGHLSPWITWPTLHRGVSSGKHHIVALGQAVEEADAHFPPVWSILARAGRRVGVFGSLHSYPLPADLNHYDFYVPIPSLGERRRNRQSFPLSSDSTCRWSTARDGTFRARFR
jgi:hypothetical protein